MAFGKLENGKLPLKYVFCFVTASRLRDMLMKWLPFCDDPKELRFVGELNKVSTLECSDEEKRFPCDTAAEAVCIRGSSHWVVRVLWLQRKRWQHLNTASENLIFKILTLYNKGSFMTSLSGSVVIGNSSKTNLLWEKRMSHQKVTFSRKK